MSRNQGSQGDTFMAAPRVVKPKRKYKEPEDEEDEEIRVAYNNTMWEKRVVRGNTYAAMVTSKNVEIPQKNTFKAKAFRPDDSSLEALSHLGRRVNIEIFTDEFVERMTDKPPSYQVGTQTDFKTETPVVRLYMKEKTGTDQQTQIWDSDLFDFDYQVEPLLQVLCGKTLELSRAQVLQEQELKVMKQKQKHYLSENSKEANKIKGMQQRQQILKEQHDRRVADLKQSKEAHRASHKKLTARTIGKRLLKHLDTNTLQIVEAHGLFRDPLENKLVQVLLPKFYSQTESELNLETVNSQQLQGILSEVYKDIVHQHRLTLQTEKTRRKLVLEDREQKVREKAGRRQMRREEQRMQKFLEDQRVWLQRMQNQANNPKEEKYEEKEVQPAESEEPQ